MKYKTPNALFPSPENAAERLAEAIYYAEPHPLDAVTTIPKTAPLIAAAFANLATPAQWRDMKSATVGTPLLMIWPDGHVQIEELEYEWGSPKSFWVETAPIGWLPLDVLPPFSPGSSNP